MKQTFMQKVFERIHSIFRKIIGHKYGCCDKWARCSRCKYVKGGDTEWTCTANFVVEQLDRLKNMTDEEKLEFLKRFFKIEGDIK